MPLQPDNQTVEQTVYLDMCLSCGICRAVCPAGAITMTARRAQFLPQIDSTACTLCGLCLRLCPGFDIFSENFRDKQIEQILSQEPFLAAYTVYSKDERIRYEGTSGGFVTHLLCLLLEDKQYDAAFVLRFDAYDGTPAELQPVSNTCDLRAAAGAKYIPASVEQVIETLKKNGARRYIITGTSCQIDGIMRYIQEYKLSTENILFCGLLCHRTFNYNAVRFYEDMFRAGKHERLTSIRFRSKERLGWPGGSKLVFSSGRETIAGQNIRKECKKYFQLNRCLACFNKFNRNADIACGDCYVPEDKNPKGSSNILIRTRKGMDIFKKYASHFVTELADLELINKSQDFLKETTEHIEHAVIMAVRLSIPVAASLDPLRTNMARRRLAREQRMLRMGQRYAYHTIRSLIRIDEFIHRDAVRWHMDTLTFALAFLTGMLTRKKKPITGNRQNVIIVGGEMFNKGAQAMTFSVVDHIRKNFPEKTCYLFSAIDYERTEADKHQYVFEIVPWDFATKLRIANRLNRLIIPGEQYALWENRLRAILQNACCMIDISGFGLSSQFGDFKSFNYLLNFVTAARYRVPVYLMPQSFGPFDYSRSRRYMLIPLMKKWLAYPSKIFYRENDAAAYLNKFKGIAAEKSPDLVLLTHSPTPNRLYRHPPVLHTPHPVTGTVGIIPNKMLEQSFERQALLALYELMVKKILDASKNVVIIQHAEDDRWLCHHLYRRFSAHRNVSAVMGDVPSFELEQLISYLDWIVGSRYHSIIHAYKHGVPAVVLGWAEKYTELMQAFAQETYCFDCRRPADTIFHGLDAMLVNYRQESKTISKNYERIVKNGNPLSAIRLS